MAERHLLYAYNIADAIAHDDKNEQAIILNNLALLYDSKGDHQRAADLYTAALTLLRTQPSSVERNVATALNNLAMASQKLGKLEAAEQHHREALGIWERLQPRDDRGLAMSHHNFAELLLITGAYTVAQSHVSRALAIKKTHLGEDHPLTAATYNLQAEIYRRTARPDQAIPLYERVLKALDNEERQPPEIRYVLANAAAAKWQVNDFEGASALFTRLENTLGQDLLDVLRTGSEEQKRLFLHYGRGNEYLAHSFVAKSATINQHFARIGFEMALHRKGILVEVLAEQFAQLQSSSNGGNKHLLDNLQVVSGRLASIPVAEYSKRHEEMVALLKERDRIESAISLMQVDLPSGLSLPSLSQIQRKVPEGTALVEYVKYREYVVGRPEPWGKYLYGAYILRPHGPVEWVQIGDAVRVDAQVTAFITALSDKSTKTHKNLGSALYDAIFTRLKHKVGDASRLFIAPDGALHLIPFAALSDTTGQYIIDRYTISYLSSARDLLPPRHAARIGGQVVIFADPDYKGSHSPLPYTDEEAKAIKRAFPQASIYKNEHATKAALMMNRPNWRILHIATHAFFEPPTFISSEFDYRSRFLGTSVEEAIGDDPLRRSGLLLAGALPKERRLTAIEVSTLPLDGIDLVVLSACETGVGDSDGDGIYGLRRALAVAGAQMQVISLWRVSDPATATLMESFYRDFATTRDGDVPAALRKAQRAIAATSDRKHPYYWAAFIPFGRVSHGAMQEAEQ